MLSNDQRRPPLGESIANPILPGFHPDPSICRVGRDYYLVTSSFEYAPGVPIFHSRDLVNWRQIGHCLTRPSQLRLSDARPSGGIFAPTLRHHAGMFYVVTTNVTVGRNFYVSAADPSGPWSDPVWVEQGGIDPSLCFDDGRVYLASTYQSRQQVPSEVGLGDFDWGIQQSEIDIATGRTLVPPRPIWSGTGGKYPEAPHLYRIGATYYLLIAEGGTEYGHMATIARSASPWGPWEPCPRNPILSHRSHHSPVQGVGHADLIEAHDGSWWAVCLGFRPRGYPPCYHLGRETFLAPVRWDGEGWPIIGDDGRLRSTMRAPDLEPHPWPAAPERDDFDAPRLGLAWNFVGAPSPGCWSLEERPGALLLRGARSRLEDGPPFAWIGRRQQHLTCEIETSLDFTPEGEGDEAGLTVWANPRHHYDLYLASVEGEARVCARCRIGGLVTVVASQAAGAGAVRLSVTADADRYDFGFATGDGARISLATSETRYLSTEVAGGFTGVFFGLYSAAGQASGIRPASFDWFDYRPR